ncbi:MAG: peptide chain release factor 2 [Clostridia bacterium]
MIYSLSRSVFDPEKIKSQIAEKKSEQEVDGFWEDQKKAQEVSKKLKSLENKLSMYDKLMKAYADCEALVEFVELDAGDEFYSELITSVKALQSEIERVKLQTLLKGKYDANNAIITLHAGAGGTEAQDWANMLFRMYQMYAEKMDYKITILDTIEGDEAGLKGVTFMVSGENAYGFLRAEKGVHRLVRISPFDSNARRQTSFASCEVMPEIDEMTEVEIKPEDLRVDTYRSSGAGGQHVNKTESAIRITHIPTGIVVACQNERSQIQNREVAMKMLESKLVELKESQEMEKLASIRGEIKKIEWGSQIRSYVFHPYSMVKDHRTNYETSDVTGVMNGNIQIFIDEYLKKSQ